jgi:RHH-type proline utilization regulon transcriptional repressor/proline dehydrogenase/delta 1-pyrroline-5-carboxylate dehydrogenase
MKLEDRIQTLGSELFNSAMQQADEPAWLDQLINHAIQDSQFRIQTLRFIDVLPSLNNDIELSRHLQQYFGNLKTPLPELAQWGLTQSDKPWLAHIAAPLVRLTIRAFSRKFMGGSTIHAAANTIKKLHHDGLNCSLDILGEASISEKEADSYQRAYLEMIPAMSMQIQQWNAAEKIEHLHGRESPVLNVSLKLSSLYSQIDAVNFKGSVNAIKHRLYPILECARDNHTFVLLDMEQYDFKNIIFQTFLEILEEPVFKDWPDVGLAIQAYLKDSFKDLATIYTVLRKRNTPATIRLVRGAYWDYETVIAEQNNWLSPVWANKQDTDANFELCLDYLFTKHPLIETAVATHNIRSIAATIALAEQHKLSIDDYEFQMLYGMADTLKDTLIKRKHHLRIYVPYGETLPGMSYLVRRLLENSSGQSILDIGLNNKQAVNLDKPAFCTVTETNTVEESKAFHNQALLRFTEITEHVCFHQAIEQCQSQLGKDYALIINGKQRTSDSTIQSINPAAPDQVIGNVFAANQQLADRAIASAKKAHDYWSKLRLSERANYLRKIATLLQQRRNEFSAWQIFEAGKNWREADADVCEAIDFLNYYAGQAEKLEHPVVNQVTGELNTARYHSRGIGLVIPPWNFPLAILVGMLSATIVCGNTAILKPSSQTPVIAVKFVALMHEAGLPDGVVNLVAGSGADIGEYLAKQADIHIIAFTGSMAVGTRLINIASQLNPEQLDVGQSHIKRVIAEMGGKNAIIIDEDADLDVAVTGTVNSAFGYQGQKCSAASRVIVLDNIYPTFMERMLEATKSIKMGSPVHPENIMGPVISQQAYNNILNAINKGKSEANMMILNNSIETADKGFFIVPTIFTDVTTDSVLAQKEIFGPVLSVMRANNFSQALNIANHSPYALTGGVYSRNPFNLQRAKAEFNVGNLYLNRKTTGAVVSRQPFGGYKLSGSGYKAGGENYLLQFMDESFISENTMRRGFAPTDKNNGDSDALH